MCTYSGVLACSRMGAAPQEDLDSWHALASERGTMVWQCKELVHKSLAWPNKCRLSREVLVALEKKKTVV
jgi:hypothetical protein